MTKQDDILKEAKRELYKQFYLSTNDGELPKNIRHYFMPVDVTYAEMEDFLETQIKKALQAREGEIVEEMRHHFHYLVWAVENKEEVDVDYHLKKAKDFLSNKTKEEDE